MRVLHLSRSDRNDSASRSALAIHLQLLELGVASRMLVDQRFTQESGVLELPRGLMQEGQGTFRNAQSFCFDSNVNDASSSAFEIGYPGNVLSAHPEVIAADVIHLHQVAGFVSPQEIGTLLDSGKHVIWSLPDHWPLTGGCFHPHQCQGFQDQCADCPQLARDEFALPAALLADKVSGLTRGNLTLLAAGSRLADAASKSSTCRGAKIEILPVPAQPSGSQSTDRRNDSPAVGGLRILIVCETQGAVPCKQIIELLTYAQTYGAFRRLVRSGAVKLAIAGLAELPGVDLPIEFRPHADLSPFEADLVVFPAIQENRHALLFEVVRSQTPVLTEAYAGLDQWIVDRKNGWLTKQSGVKALAEGLAFLAANPGIIREMSTHCQPAAQDGFPQAVRRLVEIYESSPQPERQPQRDIQERQRTSDILERCKEVEHAIATLHIKNCISSRGRSAQEELQESGRMTRAMQSLLTEAQNSLVGIERRQEQLLHEKTLAGTARKRLAQAHKSVAGLRNKLKLRLQRINERESALAKLPGRAPGTASIPHEMPSPSRLVRLIAGILTKAGLHISYRTKRSKPVQIVLEKFPAAKIADNGLPRIALVTPSYMQGAFLEKTIRSVLDQNYPDLVYAVQDGGSSDQSVEVIKQFADRISVWASQPDSGQTRAILAGFEKVSGKIMGWLNSDDLLMPGALRFVGEYFATHPEVDALYGNRVLINEDNLEFSRWVLPPHNPQLTGFIDPVPQETFFWRASAWEKVGGLDPSFRFAMDWDLVIRLQNSGAKIVHVPYFLGCFRVHSQQKTSAQMEVLGAEEIGLLRWRENGRFLEHEDLQPARQWLEIHGGIHAALLKLKLPKRIG